MPTDPTKTTEAIKATRVAFIMGENTDEGYRFFVSDIEDERLIASAGTMKAAIECARGCGYRVAPPL